MRYSTPIPPAKPEIPQLTFEDAKQRVIKAGYKVVSSFLGHVAMDRKARWSTLPFKHEKDAWKSIFKHVGFLNVVDSIKLADNPAFKVSLSPALTPTKISTHGTPLPLVGDMIYVSDLTGAHPGFNPVLREFNSFTPSGVEVVSPTGGTLCYSFWGWNIRDMHRGP